MHFTVYGNSILIVLNTIFYTIIYYAQSWGRLEISNDHMWGC